MKTQQQHNNRAALSNRAAHNNRDALRFHESNEQLWRAYLADVLAVEPPQPVRLSVTSRVVAYLRRIWK